MFNPPPPPPEPKPSENHAPQSDDIVFGKWISSLEIGAIVFLGAILAGACGGLALIAGIAAGFARAGTWADILAVFGVALLVVAAIANLTVTVLGAMVAWQTKRFRWWWLLSLIPIAGAIYGGWIAINL